MMTDNPELRALMERNYRQNSDLLRNLDSAIPLEEKFKMEEEMLFYGRQLGYPEETIRRDMGIPEYSEAEAAERVKQIMDEAKQRWAEQ